MVKYLYTKDKKTLESMLKAKEIALGDMVCITDKSNDTYCGHYVGIREVFKVFDEKDESKVKDGGLSIILSIYSLVDSAYKMISANKIPEGYKRGPSKTITPEHYFDSGVLVREIKSIEKLVTQEAKSK